MRWLSNVATSLLVAACSAIILAALQPLLLQAAPSDRLRADVVFSPWVERPLLPKQVTLEPFDTPVTEMARRESFELQDANRLASIRLQNPGKELVTNIRMRFLNEERPDVLVESEDGLLLSSYIKAKSLSLQDMKPGDIVKIYVWLNYGFDTANMAPHMITYSSQGPFDMYFKESQSVPRYQKYEYSIGSAGYMFIAFAIVALFASATIYWFVGQKRSKDEQNQNRTGNKV